MERVLIDQFYNENVLEAFTTIPDSCVDLIVSDVPYTLVGGGYTVKRDVVLRPNTVFANKGTVFKTPKIMEWIFDFYRILKDRSYCFIFMGDRSIKELRNLAEEAGFIYCQMLIMKKSNGVFNSYYFKDFEPILLFRKGKYKKFNKFGSTTTFPVKLNKGKNKLHPTEKPVSLLENFISDCSNEGDLVFDAFAGSASTLVAAKNLNRHYLGFEIDKKYYDRGIARL